MIVVVDGETGENVMAQADSLRRLSVSLRAGDPSQSGILLGDLERVDGEHVWPDTTPLKALSPPAGDAEWAADFDGVITYAESTGWIDNAGTRVRAHIG